MSAKATTPTRRTLATKPTRWEASRSRDAWESLLGPLADVRVELGGPGTTDARPYAVTANKPSKDGGS
jgi:hypothetical protein